MIIKTILHYHNYYFILGLHYVLYYNSRLHHIMRNLMIWDLQLLLGVCKLIYYKYIRICIPYRLGLYFDAKF